APKFWSDSDTVRMIREKFRTKDSEGENPDEEDEKFSREIVGASTAMLYSACDAVIAVSPKSADQLQEIAERNRVKLNLEIIPTGVNALPQPSKSDVQNFREKYGLNEDDEIILSVGRVSPEKNLEVLLHAFEKISKKNPRAKLIFVGDHNTHFDSKKTYRAKLEKLAAESPAGKKVIFTGRIEREKLGAAYKIAKVFAFPSLTDTQGLVVQEAAHFGLPIVVCDEFAPAAFQRNKNGFVAENNAEDLADKISQILNDADLARKFGRKSRALAAKLTEKAQTEKLLAVFREILQREYK
ncbi:glycosyltransferase, partial [Candidatus Saccharibacteria bacterium]|nr:glycosyltransferase [Candidatus Saccharibacteria bacterium]